MRYTDPSPFLQDEGDGVPSAVCSQHVRSLELLKTIIQVGRLPLVCSAGRIYAASGPTHLVCRDVKVDGKSLQPSIGLIRSCGPRLPRPARFAASKSYRWKPRRACGSCSRSRSAQGYLPGRSASLFWVQAVPYLCFTRMSATVTSPPHARYPVTHSPETGCKRSFSRPPFGCFVLGRIDSAIHCHAAGFVQQKHTRALL